MQCDKLRATEKAKRAGEKAADVTERAGKKTEQKAKEIGRGIGGAAQEGAEAMRGERSDSGAASSLTAGRCATASPPTRSD